MIFSTALTKKVDVPLGSCFTDGLVILIPILVNFCWKLFGVSSKFSITSGVCHYNVFFFDNVHSFLILHEKITELRVIP